MYNTEMDTQERYKTLANGAIYDNVTKRITSGAVMTSADAAQLASRKQELKRKRIEAGAAAAVEAQMPGVFTGDDGDWIEAVAQQVAYKALDKLDPKQVDAARFLLTEAGLSEAKQQQVQAQDRPFALLLTQQEQQPKVLPSPLKTHCQLTLIRQPQRLRSTLTNMVLQTEQTYQPTV